MILDQQMIQEQLPLHLLCYSLLPVFTHFDEGTFHYID